MTPPMRLKVLTPDEFVLETDIDAMRVLLPDGWWGILPGHAPMISTIHSGIIDYTRNEEKRFVALYEGTVEVKNLEDSTQVVILTSAAEAGDDLEIVKAALEQRAAKLH
jgi:F-type H+-transporting ATPase subunit epsilon